MTKYLSYAMLFLAVGLFAVAGSADAAHALPVTQDQLALSSIGLAGFGGAGMIMDKYTQFCSATALSTAATGKALVGDVVDLGGAGEDLGNGRQMYLNLEVTTAVTSAGAATVSFILASDAAAAIAVDGTASEHIVTADIPKASLVAGYRLAIPLPLGLSLPYERYIGIIQNVGTAALTAGAINAFLTLDTPAWKSYPDAVN